MSETLIYAMSSKGQLKLDQFNQLLRVVYMPNASDSEEVVDIDVKHQVVRVLDSLGYCEFDFDNRTVYMCEPCLAVLPSVGVPKAVLAGARSPSLIKKLKEVVKTFPQRAMFMHFNQDCRDVSVPACICVETVNLKVMRDIANAAGIRLHSEAPAAWELINTSDSLDSILGSLVWEKKAEPNWKKRVFKGESLTFSFKNPVSSGEDLLLTEYRNPVDQQLRHWLWEKGAAADIERDWGRYAVLAKKGINVLLYDKRLQKLAVPVTVPLPCLLARALALCSGLSPSVVTAGDIPVLEGHYLNLYSSVPVFIVELLAAKLRQKILYTSFSFDKQGVLHA